jgi:hypothetical protein
MSVLEGPEDTCLRQNDLRNDVNFKNSNEYSKKPNMNVRHTREMLTTTCASLERVDLVGQGSRSLNRDC